METINGLSAVEIVELVDACMVLAYEAGRWRGEVDLEERVDRSQDVQALIIARSGKTDQNLFSPSLDGRTTEIQLRSEQWREGATASSLAKRQEAIAMVAASLGVDRQKELFPNF